jgi:hypothetical protein
MVTNLTAIKICEMKIVAVAIEILIMAMVTVWEEKARIIDMETQIDQAVVTRETMTGIGWTVHLMKYPHGSEMKKQNAGAGWIKLMGHTGGKVLKDIPVLMPAYVKI